jgi:hypothetical protein
MQDAAVSAHRLPSSSSNVRVVGLAQQLTVELKYGVSAEDQTIYFHGEDTFGFELSEMESNGCRIVGPR